MAEWPVRIVEKLNHSWIREGHDGSTPPSEALQAEPARIVDGQRGFLVNCPLCGMVWMLDDGRRIVAVEDGEISMRPSILCGQCGGHFWLTDGMLTVV